MYVNLHSKWLETGFHLDAMNEFIQRLTSMDDVFILPVHKALEWMRDPTPMAGIKDFKPWQCDFQPNQEDKEFCSFTFRPRTTSTTPRPSTTPHHHYHNTHIDDDDDYDYRGDDYSPYDNDKDHNGMQRDARRWDGGKPGRDDRGRRQDHRKRHGDHHAHRPWFLRGSAGVSRAPSSTVVLCSVVSMVVALARS